MRSVPHFPRLLLGAALLILCGGLGWAQSDSQSLGDVAKKTKEQEATAKKSAKVYTDDDLPKSSSGSTNAPAPSSPDNAAATPSANEAKPPADASAKAADASASGGDNAAKPQSSEDAKQKLDALKADEDGSKKVVQHLQELLANETDEHRREIYTNALKHGQDHLAEVQQQRTDMERQAGSQPAASGQPGQATPEAPPEQAPQ